jgi:hypothetical protein
MPDPVGQPDTQTDSLSPWAAPYVTDMLGKGQALSNTPYQAYSGPLTAGSSALQDTAFSGLAGINIPTTEMGGYTPGSFTSPGTAEQFMNPYMSASLNPQLQEAQRQAEIQRMMDASRLTKAGAYGGSRQAIMESEGNRNLMTNLSNITGAGYNTAYTQGRDQFNTEQAQQQAAQGFNNQFGLSAIQAQLQAGDQQRGIEGEGISADYAQFKDERDDPFKKVQYQQSLLQDLPISQQNTSYIEPSDLSTAMGYLGTLGQFYRDLKGPT